MRAAWMWLVLCSLLWLTATGWSQEQAPSPDEAEIRENARLYADAFNRGDAAALAALWGPDAVYRDSDTGAELQGRAAIQTRFAALFAGEARPKIEVRVLSVRLLTPDVAIEDGAVGILAPDGSASETSYSAISVKREGKWLLDSVRETTAPPPPTPFDRLQPLAWLVGEWVDASDHTAVHSVYRWSANGAFLTQTFTAVIGDQIDLRGTQIIGWDPAEQRIRSWVFDSDGGFGEGTWELQGDRIVVHSTSTLPDGRRGSAINVYRRIDGDRFSWKSTARHVGGELMPNTDEVEIVRLEALSRSTPTPSATPE